jgi:predicted nucleic acid-binding protein
MPIGAVLPETPLAIDTDVLTDWRYQKPYAINEIRKYLERSKRPPALTSMSVFEAFYGFENTIAKTDLVNDRTQQDLSNLERLVAACPVLPFDQASAKIASYLFPRLSKSDQSKHGRDVFIIATVVAHGYGIATRNKSDFELIGGLLSANHPMLRLAIWKP